MDQKGFPISYFFAYSVKMGLQKLNLTQMKQKEQKVQIASQIINQYQPLI